jgi:crotonobetainyl-CoA:carnitine CoA-transferase CaiB-like acyl-CoA transferase
MANEQALADVKVLDFMWAMAGPAASRVLADCGATIVRVESTKRVDVTRTLTPFWRCRPARRTA